jgi:A/G-specific adenine glycosylase
MPMIVDPASPGEPGRLRKALLAWYRSHQRPLPWRERPSLYGTWISEIMLQQTVVAVVVPFWERFMARLPDVAALAAATEEEVLTLWSGLGYYRRARLLHRAAREVATERNGVLPRSRQAWLTLPGVGRYTAGAVASIGLGERVPAVDANARRVVSRWLFDDPNLAARCGIARLETLAADLVDPDRPGDWNQAVMELGATRCQARQIDCSDCPVAFACRAGRAGTALQIPPHRAAPPVVTVVTSCLIWQEDDCVVLLPPGSAPAVRATGLGRPLRTDFSGLHPGLWSLPGAPWYRKCGDVVHRERWPRAFLRTWQRWLLPQGGWDDALVLAGVVRHAITHHRLAIQVVRVAGVLGRGDKSLPPGARLVGAEQLDMLPMSNLARKCLAITGAADRHLRNEEQDGLTFLLPRTKISRGGKV